MNDSAIVIIATIGKPTLRRSVESVLRQTHEDVRCLVVIDGPKFEADAREALDGLTDRVDVITLPQNTGANGFVCHRIYGAVPMLVNQQWVFYLDDDNWYESDHVANMVKACYENDFAWCFAMRNVYHNGEFLCRDECESLGLWPVYKNQDFCHIDTNCYCLRRDVAVSLAPRWHKSRIVDGEVQPSVDTEICNFLKSQRHKFGLVPNFTVNYELGSWELSPKPSFFTEGNRQFAEACGGVLPWE